MVIWTIEAQGDTAYIEAETENAAIAKLEAITGPIPRDLLTCGIVDRVPEGFELFA